MGAKAVELGSGYGSGARYLALNFGATVDCVDLSQDANDLNRRLTEEAGLSHLVKVQHCFGLGEGGGEEDGKRENERGWNERQRKYEYTSSAAAVLHHRVTPFFHKKTQEVIETPSPGPDPTLCEGR